MFQLTPQYGLEEIHLNIFFTFAVIGLLFVLIEEVSEIQHERFLTQRAHRNEKYEQMRYIMNGRKVGRTKNETSWMNSTCLLGRINHKENGKQKERK